MNRPRIIPCLLLKGQGLVKTTRFKTPTYLGDPINVVKIFNDKEVDELVLLDVSATLEGRGPRMTQIAEIASECFMPLGYGGGIRTLDEIRQLLSIGVEKVIINSAASENPKLVREAALEAGCQSIVVSIDVKRTILGSKSVFTRSGTRNHRRNPVEYAQEMESLGAGELLLNSIDNDGVMKGYDIDLIREVSSSVNIPLIACGGAGSVQDLCEAIKVGCASAAAAGSIFVFQGRNRAVLISYPSRSDIEEVFRDVKQ